MPCIFNIICGYTTLVKARFKIKSWVISWLTKTNKHLTNVGELRNWWTSFSAMQSINPCSFFLFDEEKRCSTQGLHGKKFPFLKPPSRILLWQQELRGIVELLSVTEIRALHVSLFCGQSLSGGRPVDASRRKTDENSYSSSTISGLFCCGLCAALCNNSQVAFMIFVSSSKMCCARIQILIDYCGRAWQSARQEGVFNLYGSCKVVSNGIVIDVSRCSRKHVAAAFHDTSIRDIFMVAQLDCRFNDNLGRRLCNSFCRLNIK